MLANLCPHAIAAVQQSLVSCSTLVRAGAAADNADLRGWQRRPQVATSRMNWGVPGRYIK